MEPMSFGKNLKEQIRKRLRDDVEGTVHESLGVIIAVLEYSEDNDSEEGIIEYETGMASFVLSYSAIVFRPFKDQVLDGKVRPLSSSSPFVHFRAYSPSSIPASRLLLSPMACSMHPPNGSPRLHSPGDGCQLLGLQPQRRGPIPDDIRLET